MCGIAGFHGRFSPKLTARMIERLGHRGPDDHGTWADIERGVSLGHARLSIIDLSPAGHQPMLSGDGATVLAFNGEIYNFRELREALVADGVRFRGSSDSEVLLALYERVGEAVLTRIEGMFAFAIWDAKRGQLLIARDGYGVKPLYFAELGQGIVFASEIKALIECADLPRDLDLTALHRYISYLWSPGEATPLRAVRKLGAGEAMIVRDGRVARRWRFYDLPCMDADAKPEWTVETAQVALREHLGVAVDRQMVADVPVGAFLSGGLDSSTLVALARERRGARIPCFTMQTDNAAYRREGFADDLPYAQRVADRLDVDLHVVKVSPTMVEDLPFMLYHLDEPQADLAPLNVFHISRLAREHGVKVLLSGAGGDDLLGGYPRHRAVDLERFWAWLPTPARRMLRLASTSLPRHHPLGRRLARLFEYADLPTSARLGSYMLRGSPGHLASLFSADARAALDTDAVLAPMISALDALPASIDPIDRELQLDARFFLPDHNLNYTDKMSMAASVEVRVPFLDRDLIALAASFPREFKQRGAEGKWIFKRAMEGILSHDVIWRPKTGFGVPLRSWLHQGMVPMLDHWLSPESLSARGLFDPSAIRQLIENDRKGRVDGAYSILSVAAIEGWCRLFIDGETPPSAPVST